ncbi:MAG TPA: hypothetical protein VFG47_17280 [Geminicoccaceae bacterium]|nr:hypothetical protein [Geminicoccaceae bacterium]
MTFTGIDRARCRRLGRLATVLAGLSVAAAGAAADGPAPRGVGAEAIVKFAPGTAALQAVEQASGAASAASRQQLRALEQTLSREAGLPVVVRQLTSGREAVLAVDLQAIAAKLVRALEGEPEVEGARLVDDPASAPGPARPVTVTVQPTPGGSLAQALATAGSAGSDSALGRLEAAVEREVGAPIAAEVSSPTTLTVRLDTRALTGQLMDRLRAMPEVEYAQPNYLARPRGAPPG